MSNIKDAPMVMVLQSYFRNSDSISVHKLYINLNIQFQSKTAAKLYSLGILSTRNAGVVIGEYRCGTVIE